MQWIKILTLLYFAFLLSACGPQIGRRQPKGEWITVVSGDSISKFSDEYNIPIDDIIEMNGLRDPSRIIVGQRIFIPQLNRSVSSPNVVLTPSKSQEQSLIIPSKAPGFRALKGAPLEACKE